MTAATRQNPFPSVDPNRAVFRSAERLLASTPTRPRRRLSRTAFFVVGLLCGLGLALLLVPRVREALLPSTPVATSATSARSLPALPAGPAHRSEAATLGGTTTPLPAQSTAAVASAPAKASPSARAPSPTSRDATRVAAPAHLAPLPERPLRVLGGSAASPAMAGSTTMLVPSLGVAAWPSRLVLEGTLYTPGLPGIGVTMDLRITSTETEAAYFEGTVQIRSTVLRIAPFRVTGTFSASSIVLASAPDASGASPHSFVIELPAKARDRFTGTWSLEGRQGTLSVKTVPETAR